MKETIQKFEQLLQKGNEFVTQCAESNMSEKPFPDKWSKKEILGHLIDSGVNNLKRFTEIQFETKPFKITGYNQNALVKANAYQSAKTEELLQFWLALNIRILNLMKNQTETSLNFEIELYDNTTTDLRFLMMDYVAHLAHHLEQIMEG